MELRGGWVGIYIYTLSTTERKKSIIMYESRRFFTAVVVVVSKGINPGFPLLWGGVLMLMLIL